MLAKVRLSIIFSVLLSIEIVLLGCKTSQIPITERSGDANFAQFLESIRAAEGLPALAAAVIIDGKIHTTAAVGTRKIHTDNWVTLDDKFLIGSCGKAITATLAATLVDEGRLGWETSIRTAFPNLKMLQEYENITLRQLLSHRAGLPLINDNIIFDKNRGDAPKMLRLQYLEQTVRQKQINPQDTVLSMSNSGYMLAAAMLEAVTGQTYEKLLAEKISLPLNLTTIGVGAPAESEPMLQPFGHQKAGFTLTAVSKDHPHQWAPAGMIHLSIRDWARFILVHVDTNQTSGKNIVTPNSLKVLHSPPNSAKWAANFPLKNTFEQSGLSLNSFNYALGWFTQKSNDDYMLWHLGVTKSFIALQLVAPTAKNAILLATNAHVSLRHLINAATQIKQHYASEANLPEIIGIY